MRARVIAVLACAISLAQTTPVLAEDAAEPGPARVVLVDFESLPSVILPAFPTESAEPKPGTKARALGLKISPLADKLVAKRVGKRRKKHAKGPPSHVVEVAPAEPSLGLLYAPETGSNEYDGEGAQRMQCHEGDQVTALRWEKLAVASDGTAHLEVDDLWFDARSCRVRQGSTAVVSLKPIAWERGEPWLFAARSDSSITFVMPRSNEMSAEAMVGAPLTIRGAFTRITLPLGRWGSGSITAALASTSFEHPGKSKPLPNASRDSEASDQGSPQVSIEFVQTMAESHPTVLVLTHDPDAVASLRSGE